MATGLSVPGTAASAAVPPVRERTAKIVSADSLPTVQISGVVWTQVMIGNTVFAGGEFTAARPAGAAPGTQETARRNPLAYDIVTGTIVQTQVRLRFARWSQRWVYQASASRRRVMITALAGAMNTSWAVIGGFLLLPAARLDESTTPDFRLASSSQRNSSEVMTLTPAARTGFVRMCRRFRVSSTSTLPQTAAAICTRHRRRGELSGDLVLIQNRVDSISAEVGAYRGDHRGSRVRRTPALADDHFLAFVEELVGPYPGEQEVLGQGEQNVHDREREQLAGVDKNALQTHHPVTPECVADGVGPGAEQFAFGGDVDNILDADPAVATAG